VGWRARCWAAGTGEPGAGRPVPGGRCRAAGAGRPVPGYPTPACDLPRHEPQESAGTL